MSSSTPAPAHLPEVDGLRALAVLAVLLYHLDPAWLGGGFLGVDLFFVISGFVITRKIAPQMQAGSFSFREFYFSRARRLLPVFLLTLLLTWIAAWWLLFPNDLKNLASTTLASLAGLANYQFARHLDYFAPDVVSQPLIHLWSLAVEEQFYLIYPLLLGGLIRRRNLRGLAPVLALALVISGILSFAAPQQAFFGLESRAWELGVGCFIALGSNVNLRPQAAWIGAVLCLGGFGWISQRIPLPLPAALPVVIGGALLIATRAGGVESPLHRTLVLPPVRYLGRISYTLYLIHWPVVVFGPHLCLAWGWREKTAAAGLSLALSCLVHHALENPGRRMRLGWSLAMPLATVFVALAAVAGLTRNKQGWLGSPAELALRQVHPDCALPKPPTNQWVPLGTPEKAPDVLLIGDSHAQCLIPALDAALRKDNLTGSAWVAHATLPLAGVSTSKHSEEFRARVWPEIVRNPARHIVIMVSWTSYLTQYDLGGRSDGGRPTPEAIQAAFRETLQVLTEAGKHIILFDPVPTYLQHIPEYLVRCQRLGAAPAQELMKVDQHQERHRAALVMLDAMKAEFPATQRFYSVSLMQEDDGRLLYQQQGRSLYEDRSHLTREGAERLMPALIEALR